MGKPTPASNDLASLVVTETFAAVASGAQRFSFPGQFNLTILGTFVATIAIERSFDGGTSWVPVGADAAGTALAFTKPASVVLAELEDGVLYRARCAAWTSGTATVRFSR